MRHGVQLVKRREASALPMTSWGSCVHDPGPGCATPLSHARLMHTQCRRPQGYNFRSLRSLALRWSSKSMKHPIYITNIVNISWSTRFQNDWHWHWSETLAGQSRARPP